MMIMSTLIKNKASKRVHHSGSEVLLRTICTLSGPKWFHSEPLARLPRVFFYKLKFIFINILSTIFKNDAWFLSRLDRFFTGSREDQNIYSGS